jgi:hypothetical protein
VKSVKSVDQSNFGSNELGGPEIAYPQTEIGLVHRLRRWTLIFFVLANVLFCFGIAAKCALRALEKSRICHNCCRHYRGFGFGWSLELRAHSRS